MRRLAAVVVVAAVAAGAAPAAAQDEPSVRLILTKQSTFGTPERPLRISVAVQNDTDQPLTGLAQTVAVNSAVPSRSDYDQ
ncbi:MAG TPA: hypothetical protein VHH92_02745, partial [Actinomycetota bacterium]|nr:hypothetical protein [Actinomycetota bacterium]